ncbi:MAG: PDZ domain-containing protein, partial [Bacteriovoracaceae bacterium]
AAPPAAHRADAEDASMPGDYATSSSIEEIDLDNAKLSIKDRAQIRVRNLKDKVGRFNFRKFKTLEVPKEDSEDMSSTSKKRLSSRLSKLTDSSLKRVETGKLKALHHEVFNPKRRNQIHKTFQFVVIFSAVFILGKNLALFLKGPDMGEDLSKSMSSSSLQSLDESRLLTRGQLNEIQNSGLFKTDLGKPVDTAKKPVIAQDVKCKEASRKSNLPIQLLNTVVMQDAVKSIASVQVRSGRELTEVREGDKINGMAKIDKIDRQKLIVKNLQDGNCEVIENQADKFSRRSPIAVMSARESKSFSDRKGKVEGIENDGNSFVIEQSFIQEKMKNISDVLTQARGIQLTNPDGSLSFKIVDVEPGGIFSYLGIQNNDIITQINGKKITNLNEVMSLFGKISNVDKMNITINRSGEEVPLDYKIR